MNRFYITLTLILTLLMSQSAFGQTSIVALETMDELVVAADSRLQIIDPHGNLVRYETACKIKRFGNLYFTFAGTRWMYSFDMYKVAEEMFNQPGSILDKVNKLDNWILEQYPSILEDLRRDNPVGYRSNYERKVMLSFIVFGLENGKPFLFVRAFGAINAERISVQLITNVNCPYSACVNEQSPPLRVAMGETNTIEATGIAPKGVDLVALAERYIEMEMAAEPSHVGPPIDVVRLNRTGVHWIQRKPECADSKKKKRIKSKGNSNSRRRI